MKQIKRTYYCWICMREVTRIEPDDGLEHEPPRCCCTPMECTGEEAVEEL